MLTAALAAASAALTINTSNAAAGNYLGAPSSAVGAVGFNVSGTWVGTITFEASIDGTNWFTYAVSPITSGFVSVPQTTTSVNGQFVIHVAGFTQVRARMSAYTSGSATVSAESTAGAEGVSIFTNIEAPFATYSCRLDKVALIAGPTLCLQGSATKKVKLTRVKIGPSTATALGLQDITVQIAAAPTGVTPGTAPSADKFDSTDGAATAVPTYNTVATSGAVSATLVSEKLQSPAVGTDATASNKIEEVWGNRLSKCPTLNGTTQYFQVVADAAVAGQVCDVELEWVEF
jgi:hypothetical protein